MNNSGIEFKVWVRCITYNHAPYITEALNGFCMQETDFPYVCTIFDDASTDGEQEIIRAYLQEHFNLEGDNIVSRTEETDDYTLVFAQHKDNKNCFFAVYYLKYNHYRAKKPKVAYQRGWSYIKYEAICEGDDYWTHPKKLQRQVDFLDSHPEHSLCFHANYSLYKDNKKNAYYPYREDVDVCPKKDIILSGGNFMATASMVFVTQLGSGHRAWSKSSKVGDAPLMLTLAERGRVGYINEVMCCYRVAAQGSWTQRILMDKKKKSEHYKQTFQFLHDYDEWTNHKYHTLIKRKIMKNKLHYWLKKNTIMRNFILLIKKFK